MADLRPCSSCSRHVRAGEMRCPFCAAEIEAALPQPVPDTRLCRAAIMVVSTALAASSIGGCDGRGAPDPISVAPAYGGPPEPMPRPPTADVSASATASATATLAATASATATTKKGPTPPSSSQRP